MPSKKNKQVAGSNELVPSNDFSVDNAQKVNSTYTKFIELCKKKIESSNSINNEKIMKLNSKIAELQTDLENKKQLNQNTTEQNRNTINNLQNEINNLQSENNILKKRIMDLENTVSNFNNYIDSFNNNNQIASEYIKTLEKSDNSEPQTGGKLTNKRKSSPKRKRQSRK
jgi:hypothetical protein